MNPLKRTKNDICCYRIFRNLENYKYVVYTQAGRYELIDLCHKKRNTNSCFIATGYSWINSWRLMVVHQNSGFNIYNSSVHSLIIPVQLTPNTSQVSQESSDKNFTDVQNVPTGLFRYGGSTSWAPIRLAVDPAFNRHVQSFACNM